MTPLLSIGYLADWSKRMPLCWIDNASTQCQPDIPSQGRRCTRCFYPGQPHVYQRYQVSCNFQAQMGLTAELNRVPYTLRRDVCAYQLGQRFEGTISALYARATGADDSIAQRGIRLV